jgi:hypothetical protein
MRKRLAIGGSEIDGFGAFSLENIKKGEFIMEYSGEIIEEEELNKRQVWYEIDNIFYTFDLSEQKSVDSKIIGNKLRFANHSKLRPNAYAKVFFIQGTHRICLFASQDIHKYDEILFNYDGNNTLAEKYLWINDEINNQNKSYNNEKFIEVKLRKKKLPQKFNFISLSSIIDLEQESTINCLDKVTNFTEDSEKGCSKVIELSKSDFYNKDFLNTKRTRKDSKAVKKPKFKVTKVVREKLFKQKVKEIEFIDLTLD